MLMYVLLLVGFVLLIKGADFFVEGSSSIAKTLKVPSIIIGLTIVAMGTSAPELAVSVSAGLAGSNEIAVSNVIGSNMFNLLIIGGLTAIIAGMKVDSATLKRDFPFAIGAGIILLIFCVDVLFQGQLSTSLFDFAGNQYAGSIGLVKGLILLAFFAVYMFLLIKSTLASRKTALNAEIEEEEEEIKTHSVPVSILFVVGGAIAIVFGGDLVVDSASAIAATFGLSQTLIGLTIVAIGTSLPELVTSMVAIKKGENDLALGNIVGSNIFNIFMVLAISAICHPITVYMKNVYDLIFLAIASLFLYVCAFTKKNVSRAEGAIIFLSYIAYMVYVCIR